MSGSVSPARSTRSASVASVGHPMSTVATRSAPCSSGAAARASPRRPGKRCRSSAGDVRRGRRWRARRPPLPGSENPWHRRQRCGQDERVDQRRQDRREQARERHPVAADEHDDQGVDDESHHQRHRHASGAEERARRGREDRRGRRQQRGEHVAGTGHDVTRLGLQRERCRAAEDEHADGHAHERRRQRDQQRKHGHDVARRAHRSRRPPPAPTAQAPDGSSPRARPEAQPSAATLPTTPHRWPAASPAESPARSSRRPPAETRGVTSPPPRSPPAATVFAGRPRGAASRS